MPLETGGGIFRALPWLGPEAFLVVNADIWTDIDFGRLSLDPASDAHLVLIPNPPHHPRGDFGLDAGLVVNRDSERFTYSGVGMYRPEFFAGCAEGAFPLKPLLVRAIAAGRCSAEIHRGQWQDVGTVERLEALDRPT